MLGEQRERGVQQSFPFRHRDFSSLLPPVAAGNLAIACATSGKHDRGICLVGPDRPRLELLFRPRQPALTNRRPMEWLMVGGVRFSFESGYTQLQHRFPRYAACRGVRHFFSTGLQRLFLSTTACTRPIYTLRRHVLCFSSSIMQ
jgi:hypothetical protein